MLFGTAQTAQQPTAVFQRTSEHDVAVRIENQHNRMRRGLHLIQHRIDLVDSQARERVPMFREILVFTSDPLAGGAKHAAYADRETVCIPVVQLLQNGNPARHRPQRLLQK